MAKGETKKVRLFERGAHPDVGTWQPEQVKRLPANVADAMIAAGACELVRDAGNDEEATEVARTVARQAVQARGRAAVQKSEPPAPAPADGAKGGKRGKKAVPVKPAARPVPPPAPGTRA